MNCFNAASLNRCVAAFSALLVSFIVADRGCTAEDVPWDVAAAGEARIAVPKGWRRLDNPTRHMLAMWQGDGKGVPLLEDAGSPLQIGLTVERFPASESSLKEIVNGLVTDASSNPRLELVGEPSTETVTLSDGREAMLLTAEFIKERRRRSLQMKLVAKGADSTVWTASGYLVGGKQSKWPTAESGLAKWLRAHVLSLSLDREKFNPAPLESAYKERDEP